KKKVFAMSQIRSDILYTRKIKETRECEQEMQRLHIAVPIPNNEDKELEPDSDELYQVSDEDSNEINSKDNNKVIIREEEQR
ncbi:15790_t:CDS:1, partial [Dentiscutata erythropus]